MSFDDPQTFAILGAAIQVHNALGRGFLEVIYRRAMAVEFEATQVSFEVEPRIDVVYRDQLLGSYRPDFVCFGAVIVEIKASVSITRLGYAQTLHYLKAGPATRALLLNFGRARLEWKRFVGDGYGRGLVEEP